MADQGKPARQNPALDVSASASAGPSRFSFTFRLRIFDRRLAVAATAGIATACAVTALYKSEPGQVRNAVEGAVEEFRAYVRETWSGSIIVELYCNTEDDFLSFVEAFETKKVEQRLQEEFRKIGFKGELEVTIIDDKELYEKVNQIRQERKKRKLVQEVSESSDSGAEAFAERGFSITGAEMSPSEEMEIIPTSSSLEGGARFMLVFESDLPKDLTSARARFGDFASVELIRRLDNLLCGIVPAAPEPGIVAVVVTTNTGDLLGNARFTYVDQMAKYLEQLDVQGF